MVKVWLQKPQRRS